MTTEISPGNEVNALPETLGEPKGEWTKTNHAKGLITSCKKYGLRWKIGRIDTASPYSHTLYTTGDIFVFYQEADEGDTIPRAAIVTNKPLGESKFTIARIIGPVRANGGDSHTLLDDGMFGEVARKLGEPEFAEIDAAGFGHKMATMDRIVALEAKGKSGEELSPEELITLYELDEKIDVGEEYEIRANGIIRQLKQDRNEKADLAVATGLDESEIGTSKEDIFAGKKLEYYYGDIRLESEDFFESDDKQSVDTDSKTSKILLPKRVIGNINVSIDPNHLSNINELLDFPEDFSMEGEISIELGGRIEEVKTILANEALAGLVDNFAKNHPNLAEYIRMPNRRST